jgi:hypothetical protein
VPAGEICVAGAGEAAIVRMSNGGAPVTLVQAPSFYWPRAMIFDNSEFFVVNTEDTSADGQLSSVGASGGAPSMIGSADSIVVANGCLFAIDYWSGVYSVAASQTP